MKTIYTRKNGTRGVYTQNNEKHQVQTQFQAQADVNNIVRQYQQNPDPSVFRGLGQFQDNTLLGTYQESLDLIIQANQAFDSLPATTRDHFKNDPAKLLAFMQDPNNYDEGVKLGLVDPQTQKQNAIQNQTNQTNQNQNAKTKNKTHEGTEKQNQTDPE